MDDLSWRSTFATALSSASTQPPRVWLDIGTSERTLAKWDVTHNTSLIVVGVDPLKANVEHAMQPTTPRFLRVHGACVAEGELRNISLNVHKSPTCASVLPTRRDAPRLGQGRDACTGDVPVPTVVPAFPLHLLLRRMQRLSARVELLKIDVQGAELSCLRSGGAELGRVDNVLLEAQDADEGSGLLLYEGSPSIAQLDDFLLVHGLSRQYCEWNIFSKTVREMNCLYSRSTGSAGGRGRAGPGAGQQSTWLWATGNFQRGGSMVSYERTPRFVRAPQILTKLRTSSFAGERVGEHGLQ